MDIFQLKTVVRRMQALLQAPEPKEVRFRSFSFSRANSLESQMQFNLQQLSSQSWNLLSLGNIGRNRTAVLQILPLIAQVDSLYKNKKFDEMKSALKSIESTLDLLVVEDLEIKTPGNIPAIIKREVEEDILELRKCFQAGAYRGAVILCGRVLETCLHRKYFEITGVDILEKNPGIGLGTLVAKLVEKSVKFDPGLTQQIHLVNQVRIFSVHKKHSTFSPSRAQAQAIILFTLDTLQKMF